MEPDDYTLTYPTNITEFGTLENPKAPINVLSPKFLSDILLANKIALLIIGIISTLLNSFNLVVYWKHKKLWTTPNIM